MPDIVTYCRCLPPSGEGDTWRCRHALWERAAKPIAIGGTSIRPWRKVARLVPDPEPQTFISEARRDD
jgi:hypothetical protein